MAISSARAYHGLQADAEPTSEGVAGTLTIGPGQTVTALSSATNAITLGVEVDVGGIVELDLSTLLPALTGAGVNQVETATAVGTITAAGNATVIITGDDITGSPLTISVAVANTDTSATWAGKVRTALNSTAAITSLYTVSGATDQIILTRTLDRYNDPTLNISLDNGTCTGITPALTSTSTTEGVNPSKCWRISGTTYAGEDLEGKDLPTPTAFYGLYIAVSSTSVNTLAVSSAGGGYEDVLKPGEYVLKAGSGTINGIASTITFTGDLFYGKAIVTIIYA